jgi:hypothetical protein
VVSRSEGRLRVSENTVQRIFGQKKERKRLCNEEIHTEHTRRLTMFGLLTYFNSENLLNDIKNLIPTS